MYAITIPFSWKHNDYTGHLNTIFDSQPLYLCHHTNGTHICIDVSLYWWHHNKCVRHHTWHTYDIIPNLHPITFTLYNFTPWKLSHYIHCTHVITHPIYDITHMAIRTSYLPSDPLYLTLHLLYLCHQTQGISYTTPTLCMTSHTICMTSYSVSMTSHEHFMTSHPYRYDITSNIFMTSYPIYMISPILLSGKHNDNAWHLTHYIWHHSHCICIVTLALSLPSQQLWKSSQFAHIWHHTHTTSHHIHTLWHESSVFMKS